MESARAALDHKLANLAMGYGLSRAQLTLAKQRVEYWEQVEILEGHNAGAQAVDLAAHMVLQAAGYRPPSNGEALERLQAHGDPVRMQAAPRTDAGA